MQFTLDDFEVILDTTVSINTNSKLANVLIILMMIYEYISQFLMYCNILLHFV